MERDENEEIKSLSKIFSALSHSSRYMILKFIMKERKAAFGEILDVFEMNDNTLRFHLNKIKGAGLISQSRKGMPYKITELGELSLDFYNKMKKAIEKHIKAQKG